jgi:hypothetical protein
MLEISKAQIAKIHVLKARLGLDDEAYREMLTGVAKVASCKDLKGPKIDLVIRHLERCAGQGQALSPGGGGQKGQGPRLATARQMFAIRSLWVRVSRAVDLWGALRTFIKNRYGVERLEWLTFGQASKVIEGLKEMQRREQAGIGQEATG